VNPSNRRAACVARLSAHRRASGYRYRFDEHAARRRKHGRNFLSFVVRARPLCDVGVTPTTGKKEGATSRPKKGTIAERVSGYRYAFFVAGRRVQVQQAS